MQKLELIRNYATRKLFKFERSRLEESERKTPPITRAPKVAFVVPYYGAFPPTFPLVLETCARNPDFDWLIFTDIIPSRPWPANVKRIELSAAKLSELVEERCGFSVNIGRFPYKLCDLKPMYGWLFSEYLSGYDFWGFCDVDLFWGRIDRFITPEMLRQFDVISGAEYETSGPCCILRNCEILTRLYEEIPNLKKMIEAESNYIVDETYLTRAVRQLWRSRGIQYLFKDLHRHWGQVRLGSRPELYAWINGRVVRVRASPEGEIEILDETMYFHPVKHERLDFEMHSGIQGWIILPNELTPLESASPLLDG